jgi:hypothetical protein
MLTKHEANDLRYRVALLGGILDCCLAMVYGAKVCDAALEVDDALLMLNYKIGEAAGVSTSWPELPNTFGLAYERRKPARPMILDEHRTLERDLDEMRAVLCEVQERLARRDAKLERLARNALDRLEILQEHLNDQKRALPGWIAFVPPRLPAAGDDAPAWQRQ